jgi:hypothetical protein
MLRGKTLILPFRLPMEVDPSVSDHDLYVAGQFHQSAPNGGGHLASQVWIRLLVDAEQAHFYIIRDPDDAYGARCRTLRLVSVSAVANEARERDNAIFDGHCDIGRIEPGLPLKLSLYVSLDVALRSHEGLDGTL